MSLLKLVVSDAGRLRLEDCYEFEVSLSNIAKHHMEGGLIIKNEKHRPFPVLLFCATTAPSPTPLSLTQGATFPVDFSRWNQLDLAIVLLSIMGITLEEIEVNASLPINPTIIRIMRVLRIARGRSGCTACVCLPTGTSLPGGDRESWLWGWQWLPRGFPPSPCHR